MWKIWRPAAIVIVLVKLPRHHHWIELTDKSENFQMFVIFFDIQTFAITINIIFVIALIIDNAICHISMIFFDCNHDPAIIILLIDQWSLISVNRVQIRRKRWTWWSSPARSSPVAPPWGRTLSLLPWWSSSWPSSSSSSSGRRHGSVIFWIMWKMKDCVKY